MNKKVCENCTYRFVQSRTGSFSFRGGEAAMKKKNNDKGFNLIELMIVLAIMGILASLMYPAIVRYIDKARKAMDIQTAKVIYDAAHLASASSDDDVADGWMVSMDSAVKGSVGRQRVTASGHWYDMDRVSKDSYYVRMVAWCRGKVYTGTYASAENVMFKSVLDGTSKYALLQRKFTDEFLEDMGHGAAVGGYDDHKIGKHRTFDEDKDDLSEFLKFKYSKNAKYGNPECWILYIREDNYQPEVWIGYKSGAVKPLYRLYPNPCKEYTR